MCVCVWGGGGGVGGGGGAVREFRTEHEGKKKNRMKGTQMRHPELYNKVSA